MPAQDYRGGFVSNDSRIVGCAGDTRGILADLVVGDCTEDVMFLTRNMRDLDKVIKRLGVGGTRWYFRF